MQPRRLYRGPSTALTRILGSSYCATDACGIPCTALVRACGCATVADLGKIVGRPGPSWIFVVLCAQMLQNQVCGRPVRVKLRKRACLPHHIIEYRCIPIVLFCGDSFPTILGLRRIFLFNAGCVLLPPLCLNYGGLLLPTLCTARFPRILIAYTL